MAVQQQPQTLNQTLNLKPHTLNSNPLTPNPKPEDEDPYLGGGLWVEDFVQTARVLARTEYPKGFLYGAFGLGFREV